jgi:hypothetical protein
MSEVEKPEALRGLRRFPTTVPDSTRLAFHEAGETGLTGHARRVTVE